MQLVGGSDGSARDAPAGIDSTCLIGIPARMKKPGSPPANRAASECGMRFCEGNGTCVHRFERPGGVPFCVARCRVVFYHSLSQVSLLERNLISVFLCVNNLDEIFFVQSARQPSMGELAGSYACTHLPGHMRARLCMRMTKHLFSSGFVYRRKNTWHIVGPPDTRAGNPNASRTRRSRDVFSVRTNALDPAAHKPICANLRSNFRYRDRPHRRGERLRRPRRRTGSQVQWSRDAQRGRSNCTSRHDFQKKSRRISPAAGTSSGTSTQWSSSSCSA